MTRVLLVLCCVVGVMAQRPPCVALRPEVELDPALLEAAGTDVRLRNADVRVYSDVGEAIDCPRCDVVFDFVVATRDQLDLVGMGLDLWDLKTREDVGGACAARAGWECYPEKATICVKQVCSDEEAVTHDMTCEVVRVRRYVRVEDDSLSVARYPIVVIMPFLLVVWGVARFVYRCASQRPVVYVEDYKEQ